MRRGGVGVGVFKKTIFPLALVGYVMIINNACSWNIAKYLLYEVLIVE